MSAPARRKQVELCRSIALLLAELADSLESEIDAEPARGPGRPLIEPGPELVAEVLRLRTANGRLGFRAIGERVGLSWRIVERILAEHLPSQNSSVPSQNPGAKRGGK